MRKVFAALFLTLFAAQVAGVAGYVLEDDDCARECAAAPVPESDSPACDFCYCCSTGRVFTLAPMFQVDLPHGFESIGTPPDVAPALLRASDIFHVPRRLRLDSFVV